MAENLKELSDAATPGAVSVHEGQPCDHGDDGGGGFTMCFGAMRRLGSGPIVHRFGYAEEIWEDHFLDAYAEARANINLLAGLWNGYRAGRLHDDAALAEAEAREMRARIERAAKEIDAERSKWGWLGNQGLDAVRVVLDTLATTAPAETEERGTGWHWTATDGKPRKDDQGSEQWLLTWSEGSATADIACIDSSWLPGEEISLLCMDAWKWVEPPGSPPQPTATATREDGHA